MDFDDAAPLMPPLSTRPPNKPGSGSAQFDPNERFLTVGTVAEYFGVTEVTIKNWVDAGQLAAARTVGGHRRIAASSVVRLLEEQGRAVPAGLARRRPVVLVVDTDVSLMRVLRRAVGQKARVEVASDDYSALLLCARLKPEVMVIDVHLPGLDLRRFVHALRVEQTTRSVELVALGPTPADHKHAPPNGRGNGGRLYVKRADTTALSEAVMTRLERPRSLRRR